MVPKWTALIRPFTLQVWGLVVGTVVLFSGALALCAALIRLALQSKIYYT